MSEFFYQSGWGAFTMMLLMAIPFAIVFAVVIYSRGFATSGAGTTKGTRLSRLEAMWLGFAGLVFLLVNLLSIRYFPMVSTAQAAATPEEVRDVEVVARSWGYHISDRELEVGEAVRFSAKAADTMHSFTLYHPDGRVLFTMQLIPGLEQAASLIYTFKDPGKYKVRCLEYCGIAHHAMQAELVVVDKRS